MHCTQSSDCPSGYDCGSVIFSCGGLGGFCQSIPGDTVSCKAFLVENEVGDQYYCADSSGQPHEYYRACAPNSGFCPATPSL
jgi:hypothetical protein